MDFDHQIPWDIAVASLVPYLRPVYIIPYVDFIHVNNVFLKPECRYLWRPGAVDPLELDDR